MKKSPLLDVRELGCMLWQASIEHTRSLKWVPTNKEPYAVLPTAVSIPCMFVLDELILVGEAVFDRRFIAQQTASFKETLALAQAYARDGDDLDFKEYDARTVPKLDRILEIEIWQRFASRQHLI